MKIFLWTLFFSFCTLVSVAYAIDPKEILEKRQDELFNFLNQFFRVLGDDPLDEKVIRELVERPNLTETDVFGKMELTAPAGRKTDFFTNLQLRIKDVNEARENLPKVSAQTSPLAPTQKAKSVSIGTTTRLTSRWQGFKSASRNIRNAASSRLRASGGAITNVARNNPELLTLVCLQIAQDGLFEGKTIDQLILPESCQRTINDFIYRITPVYREKKDLKYY